MREKRETMERLLTELKRDRKVSADGKGNREACCSKRRVSGN